MAFYEWNPNLDIHVKEMNDEHKALIDLMNLLHDEAKSGLAKPQLQETFQELMDYTRQHFSDEEEYMYSINYPGLATHKLMHARFLNQLHGYFEAFRSGNGTIGAEVFDFFKTWLSAHIGGIDIQYAQHSRSVRRTA